MAANWRSLRCEKRAWPRTGGFAVAAAVVACVTLPGCSLVPAAKPAATATPARTSSPAAPAATATPTITAESILAEALRAYDDGRYPVAQRGLRDALEAGLKARADRVNAHKHLAFIYCSSRQDALCRDAFRRALELDPTFTLTPAEAGHPLWGPVFRNLKARTTP